MFSYRGGVVNQFLIGWGMYELSRQNVPWLYSNRNCIAAAWGMIAVVVGKQSTTIADEIGHVFADLLSINLRG